MSLTGIVTVNVTRQNAGVDTAGFGKLAIFAYHNKHTERVLEFTDAASMLQANGGPFLSTDLTYIMAQSAFSQNPKPTSILSVRRVFATTRTVSITPKATIIAGEQYPLNNTDYTITINGEVFTYTTDASATVAEIIAGLTTLIHAGSQNVIVVAGSASLLLYTSVSPGNNAAPGPSYTLEVDSNLFDVKDITAVPTAGTMADEIAAAIDIDDSFYGIVGDWFSEALIMDVAAAVESMDRFFVGSSMDSNILDQTDSTDVGSVAQAAGYKNTHVFHSSQPHLAAAGYMGRILPTVPGSATHAFKEIAGLTAGVYNQTQISSMLSKNVGYYIRRLGRNITHEGRTAHGEWIDVQRFIHWLKARVCEAVFSLKVSNAKIPFTNAGIAMVENAVRGVFATGIANGGLAADPPPEFTVPDARTNVEGGVNVIDKANRFLNFVSACGTLQGAIHDSLIEIKVID